MKQGIIIGFGNMGQNHYERYKNLDVNIIAIIDNDKEKGRMADHRGIEWRLDP